MQTLAQFMEASLYGSGGYYSCGRAQTGMRGDYFTAPETGVAFGQLLANIFQQWRMRFSNPFHVIEVGAGEGRLMQIVASPQPSPTGRGSFPECSLSREGEGWGEATLYHVVERSDTRRNKIRQLNLPIQIHDDFSKMKKESMNGIIFANELIDAFPVHRVRMKNGKLQEAFAPALTWSSPSTPRLAAYFDRLKIILPEGYETEINLAMRDWIQQAAQTLVKGLLVLIDYGRPAWDYYAEERNGGTLRGFKEHRVLGLPELLAEGSQADWTADVDFTSLALDAKEVGLMPLAFMEMGTFLKQGLVGVGHRPHPQSQSKSPLELGRDGGRPQGAAPTAGLKYLLHPEGLGTQFHVLILGKNIDPADWAFAHNRIVRLGLPA